jgi:cytochrome c biogenesis protein CcdA/thiol-disulfide isomerase/thioredoxin
MLLLVLAYLRGALTILSPCILPVLPFVFSRSDQPFVRSGLPLLAGMAITFAAVASLAAIGGGWATQANQYGRWVALALFGVFGLTLLLPALSERLMRPLVSAGSRLTDLATEKDRGPRIASSVVLGVATGLLWAPCAGPILGLVLTGAALRGASAGTTLLLLAYAAGASTSLALALLLGGRMLAAMKRSLGAGEWIRRGIGVAILCGAGAIATGLDTGALARVSVLATSGLEEQLVGRLSSSSASPTKTDGTRDESLKPAASTALGSESLSRFITKVALRTTEPSLPVEGRLPALSGAVQWLNSPPLTAADLRGKVVLVDFWTYSCINCLRTLPYVKAWSKKYHDQGLVVIGVHAPEFAFEHDIGNVKRATRDLGVDYPVAMDNNFAIWRALGNQYWPALYFVDAEGRVRHHQFGEGGYAKSEDVIRQLLAESGQGNVPVATGDTVASGSQAAPDLKDLLSNETYIGYKEAEGFASSDGVLADKVRTYATPARISLNDWGLDGDWNIGPEQASLAGSSGKIVYRFHARDLHLVMGSASDSKPVRFRVTIDGAAPGPAHGADVAADGTGTVSGQRLYQLVRQTGEIRDRTFAIEFLDPGVKAYAFTFG